MTFPNQRMLDLGCVGINMPHCSMTWKRPTVFSAMDFPPALGPLMTTKRWVGRNSISSGMTSRFLAFCTRRNTGFMAFRRLISPSSLMRGKQAPSSLANRVLANKMSSSVRRSSVA